MYILHNMFAWKAQALFYKQNRSW